MAAAKCHNCRRRRLRCDQSFPACHKCSVNGEECLGYGQILRWADAPALRGKLAGGVLGGDTRSGPRHPGATPISLSVIPAPLDPIINNLDKTSRYYIHHFSTTVCRDLVSIDQDSRNPFRIMIPLIRQYDYLQAIVIATSAMHLATLHRFRGRPTAGNELVDALVAKGKAIKLLRAAVDNNLTASAASQTTLLAAIVFFVNLDLIDSGKGGWKAHMEAARRLISSIYRRTARTSNSTDLDTALAPLADAIAADCLTYQILGTTISIVDGTWSGTLEDDVDVFSMLHRAQAYSYHCCPPPIMQCILSASQLGATENAAATTAFLLQQTRSLDVHAWVHSIRGLLPQDDLDARIELASAHRAAACLYILLSGPGVDDASQLDGLVLEILHHLSMIPGDHVLLKGTVWPTFMAGAQTDDPVWRSWCLQRLRAVWTQNPWVCPWGYVMTATEMMQRIWDARDNKGGQGSGRNWLRRLKDSKENLLIV